MLGRLVKRNEDMTALLYEPLASRYTFGIASTDSRYTLTLPIRKLLLNRFQRDLWHRTDTAIVLSGPGAVWDHGPMLGGAQSYHPEFATVLFEDAV